MYIGCPLRFCRWLLEESPENSGWQGPNQAVRSDVGEISSVGTGKAFGKNVIGQHTHDISRSETPESARDAEREKGCEGCMLPVAVLLFQYPKQFCFDENRLKVAGFVSFLRINIHTLVSALKPQSCRVASPGSF